MRGKVFALFCIECAGRQRNKACISCERESVSERPFFWRNWKSDLLDARSKKLERDTHTRRQRTQRGRQSNTHTHSTHESCHRSATARLRKRGPFLNGALELRNTEPSSSGSCLLPCPSSFSPPQPRAYSLLLFKATRFVVVDRFKNNQSLLHQPRIPAPLAKLQPTRSTFGSAQVYRLWSTSFLPPSTAHLCPTWSTPPIS